MKTVYLASPYTHANPAVMELRVKQAAAAAAKLMTEGYIIFSPVVHSHYVAKFGNLDAVDLEFWMKQDMPLLATMQELFVLELSGWQGSKGVQREIRLAKEHGMPITYMDGRLFEALEFPQDEFLGDEPKVISLITERLRMGARQYGQLDIKGDRRDWEIEALEEDLDGMVYRACEIIRRKQW